MLVVDDQPDAVKAMGMLLQLLGHEAHGLVRGAGAVEAVDRLAPAVVFLDIGLPDVSGYEIAREVRERERETGRPAPYLVAITGWGAAADRARALDAGFDEHVVKPIDVAVIQAVLQRATAARGLTARAAARR